MHIESGKHFKMLAYYGEVKVKDIRQECLARALGPEVSETMEAVVLWLYPLNIIAWEYVGTREVIPTR